MTVSIWQADETQPTREVDLLVIGAGLVGCTAAYFAAQAGRSVVITDAADVGLGASGRNAGFMITGLDTYYHHAIDRYGHDVTREVWRLSEATHAQWHLFAAAGHVPLQQSGSLLLAESTAEKHDLKLAAQAMQADGIAVIYHDSDPLGRGYHAAIAQPWDAAVQPYALTRAILEQSGAELVTGNEIYAITQQDDRRVQVDGRRVRFVARNVLLCTNAYSPRLHPYFVGKVTPKRAQVLVTPPLPDPLLHTCGYSDYGFMYYRMTFDNRLLVGGGRKQNIALEDDTTEDRTNSPVQDVLAAYVRQRFPEALDAAGTLPVARRWAGIMGFTPDGLPLVGKLPDQPDVGFAVGFTGHGLALGAATARLAVDHLLKAADAGVFDAGRLPADHS